MESNERHEALVSVVMATYNGERFIAEQIQSILMQSHENIELIVQDDQSTDATVRIVESFQDRLTIRLQVNERRLGFVGNFERGIARARGAYIALCDQDDVWVENKIEIMLDEIGDADLIHSNCELIGEKGNLLAASWRKKEQVRNTASELLFYNGITGCTALFRRELLKHCLPFPDGLAYHDWWLAMCASVQNGIKYLDLPLVKYRQHGTQETGAFVAKGARAAAIWKKLRLLNKERKAGGSEKQLRNLTSGKSFLLKFVQVDSLKEAIQYHQSLSQGFFHFRAFWIGIRKPGTLWPGDNLALLKLINNLVG